MQYHKLYKLARFEREYAHKRLKENGISDTEYIICIFLNRNGSASQEAIARGTCTNKTTVAKALKSLEAKGLAESMRNPENRRENIITLSEEGKRYLSLVKDLYIEWMGRVTCCLSESEKAAFDLICGKLILEAGKINEEE